MWLRGVIPLGMGILNRWNAEEVEEEENAVLKQRKQDLCQRKKEDVKHRG